MSCEKRLCPRSCAEPPALPAACCPPCPGNGGCPGTAPPCPAGAPHGGVGGPAGVGAGLKHLSVSRSRPAPAAGRLRVPVPRRLTHWPPTIDPAPPAPLGTAPAPHHSPPQPLSGELGGLGASSDHAEPTRAPIDSRSAPRCPRSTHQQPPGSGTPQGWGPLCGVTDQQGEPGWARGSQRPKCHARRLKRRRMKKERRKKGIYRTSRPGPPVPPGWGVAGEGMPSQEGGQCHPCSHGSISTLTGAFPPPWVHTYPHGCPPAHGCVPTPMGARALPPSGAEARGCGAPPAPRRPTEAGPAPALHPSASLGAGCGAGRCSWPGWGAPGSWGGGQLPTHPLPNKVTLIFTPCPLPPACTC